MSVLLGHPHLSARGVGQFVENLHADGAAAADDRFLAVGLRRVAGGQGDEKLVSKKLPGIRLVPVELEIGRKTSAEGTQSVQQFRPAGLARDREFALVDDMDFDLVAFLESKRRNHGGGKTDRQAVAPFGDLHANLR
jgi:hypothetical protein